MALLAAAKLPAGVEADTALTIRATIDAVQGHQGDPGARQRAVDAFTALAGRRTGKDRAIALNNAALASAPAGDAEAAVNLTPATTSARWRSGCRRARWLIISASTLDALLAARPRRPAKR